MPDLASLGLAIDSRPAVEAATALDKMGEAAARGEGRIKQIATAADALIAALNRNTAATESLTTKILSMEAASTKASTAVSAVGTAAEGAASNVVKFDRAAGSAKASADAMAASARNSTAAWAALGTMGAATAEKLEIARRMASASAVIAAAPVYRVDQGAAWAGLGDQGRATLDNLDFQRRMERGSAVKTPAQLAAERDAMRAGGGAGVTGGFTRAQQANLGNLAQQGADVAVTAAMGMNPFMIALQQGPQIAQSFAGPGALKIGEIFSAAGDKAGALAARIGIVGGAIGGLTGTVLTAIAAQQSFSATQTDIAQKVSGVGRASGVTVSQINALAPAAAAAGNVSVRSAREMAGEFAATGRIGQEMLGGLIGSAKDYAATTGQELPDATKALAAAFADPAKGADTLNRQLGFLDASARENIQTLAAQGDRLGAQRALFDAYKGSLTSATELTSSWGRVTGAVGRTISDTWDKVGEVIDRVATGGDLETQIETARRVLANSQARQGYLPFGIGESDTAQAQATLDGLLRQQQQRQAQSRQTDLNQRSTAVDDIVKQFSPAQERVKQIEQAATRIRTELAAGVLDPDGKSARTATELEASARRIREDLTQGGTQFANAIRDAQFGLRTVGFSPQAQRVAGINERAANEIRALGTSSDDPLLRDFQINAIRERARIEQEAARQQVIYDTSSGSGRYRMGLGQAPVEYRDRYYDAATRYGLNPDLLVSQGYQESRFNPNAVSPAGARGIAQFMPGTARGYGLTDPFDATAAIDAQGRLMRDLMRQFNGNEVAALIGYNAGPRVAQRFLSSGSDTSVIPAETRDYIKQVLTPAPGAQQAVAADVERRRGLENEARIVEINTQYLGRNGQALEEQTRYQQLLNQAISEGREVTPGLRDELQRMASGMVTASRALRATEAGRSLEFERDQLGRTRIEQASYGRARGIFGDTASPMAQAYIQEANDNARLYESKAAVTDAMGGFVTDLRRGASAADAASSALGRLADRALNSLTDTVASALFSKGTSGGGIGDFFSGILGIGSAAAGGSGFGGLPMTGGEWFANGGIMTSRGRIPLNAYAGGGIADSPQMAIFGEGRMPEAYVPLPDGRRIPVAMQGGGAANANTGPSSVSNIDARTTINAPGADRQGLADLKAYIDERDRQLPQRIRELQRRAG